MAVPVSVSTQPPLRPLDEAPLPHPALEQPWTLGAEQVPGLMGAQRAVPACPRDAVAGHQCPHRVLPRPKDPSLQEGPCRASPRPPPRPWPINPATDLCQAGVEVPPTPPCRGTAPMGDKLLLKAGHGGLGHRLDTPAPTAAGPVPHVQRPAPAWGPGWAGALVAQGVRVHGPQPPLPLLQSLPGLCLGG